MYIYIYIATYVHIYIHIYIMSIYMYTRTHTHTHIPRSGKNERGIGAGEKEGGSNKRFLFFWKVMNLILTCASPPPTPQFLTRPLI